MVFFSNGACQSELVANLLKTLLVATYAEALADDSDFAVLEHLIEHGVQLKSH